ncbi:hypothetical protein HAX54_053235 [Datura stramonium]|uniref:Uncharacterized protein n=1 Tax=Datura stramonium TaxID=4076 RepID=A0ABS8T155_DATST|nr:hypothetical protein [Datura stramonium]
MPRLVERIQASSNSNNHHQVININQQITNDNIIINNNNNNNIVPNMNYSSTTTTTTSSSENSFGTQISDMSDNCYTNYPLNQGDYGEILISPRGDYFQHGALDFRTVDIIDYNNNNQQNMNQLFLDDGSDNLWNIEDMLFLQQQLN